MAAKPARPARAVLTDPLTYNDRTIATFDYVENVADWVAAQNIADLTDLSTHIDIGSQSLVTAGDVSGGNRAHALAWTDVDASFQGDGAITGFYGWGGIASGRRRGGVGGIQDGADPDRVGAGVWVRNSTVAGNDIISLHTYFRADGTTETAAGLNYTIGVQPAEEIGIAADAAVSFTPPQLQGLAAVVMDPDDTAPSVDRYALFFYATASGGGAPSISEIGKGANVALTTGVLSGTTGTAGRTTISAHSDGNIYVENRSSVFQRCRITWLGDGMA